jgi:hypothetical protein
LTDYRRVILTGVSKINKRIVKNILEAFGVKYEEQSVQIVVYVPIPILCIDAIRKLGINDVLEQVN